MGRGHYQGLVEEIERWENYLGGLLDATSTISILRR